MTVVLADLGGTNLRLARAENPADIKTFLIKDHPSFESVLSGYAPDATELYLASAITPLNGIVEDIRFSTESHWRIDLNEMREKIAVTVLNDLEAAAYGLASIDKTSLPFICEPKAAQTQFDSPPDILVSVGTGIGHAFIFEKKGRTFVQRTHGGWIAPFGIGAEHEEMIAAVRRHKDRGRDMVMEDIVSGYGLWTLRELVGPDSALRLFWEFLGLYCNTLATVSGGYGGLYLTGGIIDDMVTDGLLDTDSFRRFFIRPLAQSVVESLSATPVRYCTDINLPVAGLSEYRKMQ